MSWGAACAAIYSFGSYSTYNGSNGQDALGGSAALSITNSNNAVLSASQVVGTTPTNGAYPITVTQLASAMQLSASPTAGQALNGGNAFDVILTPQGGSATVLNIPAGKTLADVRDAINTQTGFTATISTRVGSDPVLTVVGPSGSGHDFTLVTQARDGSGALLAGPVGVTGLTFMPPAATTYNGVTYTPLGATSQDAIYTINGAPQTPSPTNVVTVGGLSVNLLTTGSSTLTTSQVSGLVPSGVNGLAGVGGVPVSMNINASSINVPGNGVVAFSLRSTGGQGGDAGIGGIGGYGGAGGAGITGSTWATPSTTSRQMACRITRSSPISCFKSPTATI